MSNAMVLVACNLLFMYSQLAQYNAQKLRDNGIHILLNQIFANDDPHIVIEQLKVLLFM